MMIMKMMMNQVCESVSSRDWWLLLLLFYHALFSFSFVED